MGASSQQKNNLSILELAAFTLAQHGMFPSIQEATGFISSGVGDENLGLETQRGRSHPA